jgi:menaquinone-specific isochorismate synthase
VRIFWSDRNGNPPPVDAIFSWRTFDSQIRSAPYVPVQLPPPASYKVVKQSFVPTKEQWSELLQKGKSLPKVVLARACVMELSEKPDPFAVTAALLQKAKNSYVFCLSENGKSFLGATPENLFSRKKSEIVAEALAGTKPIGASFTEKDHREFAYIPAYLKEVLPPFCHSLKFNPVSITSTSHLQHLHSSCTATLKKTVTDERLLAALHPTPALCGTPKQKAFEFIQMHEPFQRGLYGGVIGWKTENASDWAVAIRSCLIEENRVTLYTGAGIVEGSDPDLEWEELDQKLKLYDGIFVH